MGGLDLGLERAGWTCVGQVEADEFCRAVLGQHWPDVPCFDDVRTVDASDFAELGPIDAIVGGPPCQPASVAGRRDGAADDRWLWPDFLRLVREIAPRWVLAENVLGLVTLEPHGLDWVCDELEAAGYALAPPVVVGARHVGAPHRRDRVWIVGRLADAERDSVRDVEQRMPGRRSRGVCDQGEAVVREHGAEGLGHADYGDDRGLHAQRNQESSRILRGFSQGASGQRASSAGRASTYLADADGERRELERSSGLLHGERSALGDNAHGRYRWPARPCEPQHEWEESRVVPAIGDVGVAASWLAERLDERGALDAAANPTGRSEVVRELRDAINAQALQWRSRKSQCLSTASLLRPEVHGREKDGARLSPARNSARPDEASLQKLRSGETPAASSSRRGSHQQPPRKHQDLVCELSFQVALAAREKAVQGAPNLLRLRPAISAARDVRSALSALEEAWRSSSPAGQACIAIGLGPLLVARLNRHRRAALRALGNAVVPQVAEQIGRAILTADSGGER
ncbi:MAG: hypothetical protein C4558_06360 [Dehalococcoidia bacterium]|nr:MAG: hypothetical protein C4558_06360 [Dehalococcoidia bacterium]